MKIYQTPEAERIDLVWSDILTASPYTDGNYNNLDAQDHISFYSSVFR